MRQNVSPRTSLTYLPPDVLFRNVPDLTSTTKNIGTRPFAYGGYSDIWRGVEWSGDTSRDVVLKIIRVATRQKIGIERMKKRISREVIVWYKLKHENILPFYGLCWLPEDGQDGLPSMVYPYCEAGTCTDYLKDHPDTNKIEIICQVGDAVDYLHTLHPPIVHGDIKASNILMKTDGTPLLADFGLSRVIMEVSTGLTTSSNRGSWRWMAPELLGGAEKQVVLVSTASDVWAFGCLCLEILSGTHPWASAGTDAAVILAVVVKRHRPKLPEDVGSTDLGHIIEHCWAHRAEHRPSMAQLVSALLHNNPEVLHNPTCVVQPADELSDSGSPQSTHNSDLDLLTPMLSDNLLVTLDQWVWSSSIGGTNPLPSPSDTTPDIDPSGPTPSDSSSSGEPPRTAHLPRAFTDYLYYGWFLLVLLLISLSFIPFDRLFSSCAFVVPV